MWAWGYAKEIPYFSYVPALANLRSPRRARRGRDLGAWVRRPRCHVNPSRCHVRPLRALPHLSPRPLPSCRMAREDQAGRSLMAGAPTAPQSI